MILFLDRIDFDLNACLQQRFPNGMPLSLVRRCLHQTLLGLAFCHSLGLHHRDIKPHNVLISASTGQIRIADFGKSVARPACNIPPLSGPRAKTLPPPILRALASCPGFVLDQRHPPSRASGEGLGYVCGTPCYMAPELMLGQRDAGCWSDIWAVGCMLPQLCSGKKLISVDPDDPDDDGLISIFETLGTPDEHIWPGVSSLPYWKDFKDAPRCDPPEPDEIVTWIVQQGPSDLPPALGRLAADLLANLLTYPPASRATSRAALSHALFDDEHGSTAPVPLARYAKDASIATERAPGGRAKRMRPA